MTTTTVIRDRLGDLWKTMMAWGALNIALGAVILLWPGISLLVAAVFFGAFLLISGIAQVVAAFALDVTAGGRVLYFLTGALSIVLGVLAFRRFGEGYALLLLAIWIGVGFIVQGVAETGLAISHDRLPARGWHVFAGVVSIIAGVVVMVWPFSSIATLTIVAGAWLVVVGVTQVIWAIQARRRTRRVEKGIERLASAA
jgi:uncharacterized membrane protein HdeD (DUF308 family)